MVKGTRYKSLVGGYKTDTAHDRVLGMSVNIPATAFCPPMCILFLCSESYFYIFGTIEVLGWVDISTWRRWAGLGYQSATGDPPFLVQNGMTNDHFMEKAKEF